MNKLRVAASLALVVGLLALGGCGPAPLHIDPLAINGRDGGGRPVSYAALMRIGAAAHAGGDLANALAIYRRAAEIDTHAAAPFAAAGGVLLEMGQINEAIVSYNSALARDPDDRGALRGLAKAYLRTGRPELANTPLAKAYQDTPNDPKLLQLIGVANDSTEQHAIAQDWYRRGLALAPRDPGLTTDLALSLALSGNDAAAIKLLQPVASGPLATPRERQTLALIYGLDGNRAAAERLSRIDLDAAAVAHNLAYYDTLRHLSPAARSRAILSASVETARLPHS
jgi:Flp pilus assembly protein TadD